MAMVATLMASCMGSDYAAPGLDPDNAPWGNNEITETNVVSIADLKARYASTIASNGYVKIEEDRARRDGCPGGRCQRQRAPWFLARRPGNLDRLERPLHRRLRRAMPDRQRIYQPQHGQDGYRQNGRAMPDRQRIYQPQHGQDGHRQNGQVYLAEALSLDRRG